MRVLDFIIHPPFQHNLCKTGHDFCFLPSECWDHWDDSLRPLPGNASIGDDATDLGAFDLAIAATRERYRRIATLRLPKVFLSHTVLHPWDRGFFRALPREVEVVYISDHRRATFGGLGRRGRTIRLAVDAETEFSGYTGESASVLNVTNQYAQEKDRGYELFERLTQGLPSQVVGHGNEAIPGAVAEPIKCRLGREFIENHHAIHTLQGREDRHTLPGGNNGPARTLQRPDRGVAVDTHDQYVSEVAGHAEAGHMPDVQQVEATVGPDYGVTCSAPLLAQGQELIPVQHLGAAQNRRQAGAPVDWTVGGMIPIFHCTTTLCSGG